MSGTSGESLSNETYKKAEQVYENSENRTLTNLETARSRNTPVIQNEANIRVRIVPHPPRLGKDQIQTD